MFDFSKLGDLSKMAGEAKQMQEKQERFQAEQLEVLKKISAKLDQIILLLKEKN
jgi:hypothetical protein